MNLVKVIMSIYSKDTQNSVKRAVESILAQQDTNVELYIMFDGFVANEIQKYCRALRNSKVYVYTREKNKGLAISLNELLMVIMKEEDNCYIARMDADDFAHPDRFQKQVEYLNSHPNIDIVGSYIFEKNKDKFNIVKYPIEHRQMKEVFGRRNPLAHPSVMFRKSFFDKVGLYPTHSLRDEDTLLWLKGFLNDKVRFANVALPLHTMYVDEDFFKRRKGLKKSLSDFKNRILIINRLNLSSTNYFFAFGRFLLFSFCPSKVIKLAYRTIR